jgi:hypothetical protein
MPRNLNGVVQESGIRFLRWRLCCTTYNFGRPPRTCYNPEQYVPNRHVVLCDEGLFMRERDGIRRKEPIRKNGVHMVGEPQAPRPGLADHSRCSVKLQRLVVAVIAMAIVGGKSGMARPVLHAMTMARFKLRGVFSRDALYAPRYR